MVSHLFNAPEVKIEFDDRQYRPGETVKLSVSINGAEVIHQIRSAEVEMVATVSYSETIASANVPRSRGGSGGGFLSVPRQRSRRTTNHYEEQYTLAAVELADHELVPIEGSTFEVEIPIGNEPPPNWHKGTASYRLVVTIDLAGERDAHAEREVLVQLQTS